MLLVGSDFRIMKDYFKFWCFLMGNEKILFNSLYGFKVYLEFMVFVFELYRSVCE